MDGCFEALSDNLERMSQSEYDKKEIYVRDKIAQGLDDEVVAKRLLRGSRTISR